MTVEECVARIKREAAAAGLTMEEYADGISRASPEDIALAMESMSTSALEWGVRFEALSHRRQE